MDALAETWGRTMYGGISEWCRKRKVQSIGHFMEHSNLYQNREYSAGDMMRLQAYSHMGGIDAVFDQFIMGKRDTRDNPCWQTPKLGSSITHAYGKPRDISMVEIFGARGQSLTYPEMKWWTDHMHVSGVNFLIPHSFNPKSPNDTDCPPYFYNNGYEPRWPLYRVFADYTSRLSVMLTGGRHVCPVALLYLGQSAHTGKHILPEQMSEVLQDALYDCDWMPYEVFERNTSLRGNELKLRDESYKILVVPPVEVIPYATLAKAKQFFDKGGIVLAHGFLPTRSATPGKGSADIAQLREALWGSPETGLAVCKTNRAGGRSYLLPARPTPEQLQQVLAGAGLRPTLEVLDGKTDHWLHVLHRVKEGRDVFFVANQNHEGNPRTFRFRIEANGVPECWDAMRNEITTVPFTRNDRHVDLSLTLEPNESVLLVFQPKARPLPIRQEPGAAPLRTVALNPQPVSVSPPPPLASVSPSAALFNDCSWIWHPDGNATQPAPAGNCYFRKEISIDPARKIKKATFFGTADNSLELFINGKPAGRSDSSPEGWRNPVELDVTPFVRTGANQLAILANNLGTKPSPAGVIGGLVITFETGPALTQRIDQTWKSAKECVEGWTNAGYNDSSWQTAQVGAKFGAAPWGMLSRKVTLSPVTADPFLGRCELTPADLKNTRVYLEAADIGPETAARVSVNRTDAGGFIGQPARLEITRYLKPGVNTVRLDPFSAKSARLAIYPVN
ncbi:MAG TPA: glycosyl hydrolase [Clostridia bacterium]|nr:glycosyl hydrolase [Clostridia bacterium]